jgi:hypothetical protein
MVPKPGLTVFHRDIAFEPLGVFCRAGQYLSWDALDNGRRSATHFNLSTAAGHRFDMMVGTLARTPFQQGRAFHDQSCERAVSAQGGIVQRL